MGSNQKLVDYFVICGLNVESGLEPDKLAGDNLDCSPLERSYKCHILSHLPESVPGFPFDGEAVAMLCFPKGLSFTTNCNKQQQLHTFVITREDGARSYGTALTFYEQIESPEICLAMQVLQDMHMAELSNSQSLTLKRQRERQSMRAVLTDEFNIDLPSKYSSLDRVTTSPSSLSAYRNDNFFKPHQKQSVYQRNQDILHCSKCICIISKLPLVDSFTKILTALYELMKLSDTSKHQVSTHQQTETKPTCLPLESYIFNLLHEVEYLPAGMSMRMTTWKGPVICQRPGTNELPLCDYPLRGLFDIFSVEEVITIFSCMLLEHQILIFSSDYGKLMLVAECLCCLLFPFIWQHTYVPILPASLLHFLDAPVPFIMGLQLGLEEQEAIFESFSKPNSCAVDIDKRRVAHPEDIPSFPHLPNLTGDVKDEIKKMRKSEKSSPSSSSAESRDSGFIGFIRDSYCGPDDGSAGEPASVSSSGAGLTLNNTVSDWSLNAKMEMLQKNEALSKMTALARKSGIMSSMDEIKDSISEAAMNRGAYGGRPSSAKFDEHTKDLLFNSSIREIFLHYFFQIFGSYESFVIHHSGSDVQSWLSNRETTQNFDKTAFLTDQSEEALPFLASFIETQMFASFIDQKILSRLESSAANLGTRDRENFVVFENRLKSLKDDLQQSADQRPRRFYRTAAAKESESFIQKRATQIDIIATSPRNIEIGVQHRQHFFPTFPSNCFDGCILQGKKTKSAFEEWRSRYGMKARGDKTTFKQREEYMLEVQQKTSGNSSSSSGNNNDSCCGSNNNNNASQQQQPDTDFRAMVNNNWRFMERLLKEVKTKTKRMLVQKMGKEAVELGHGEVTRSGIEENTLIASLCDLLERIWSYGLIEKQDKSSLWYHITSYSEAVIKNDQNNNNNSNNNNNNNNINRSTDNNNNNNSQFSNRDSTLPNQELPASTSTSSSATTSTTTSSDGNLTWPIRHHPHHHHSRKLSRGLEWPAIEPLPISVLTDFRNVLQMTEIKTSVGYSRAFVRLSLEKKLLSRHLKELFSNQDLLRKLYKRYSFLRCEDEREQFLYHLLSLNAVDYYCFTNSFTNTNMLYRILIFPRIKIGGGTTTANCWIRLSGQLGSTEDLPLPKHSLDVLIKHKNLGVLTTLRIGHDNSGLSAKWMVEHVLVRNELTGHTYKFTCGRWLGKGVDDGALERLLVAEMVPPTVDSNELIERCRTPPRCRSPSASGRHIEPRISVNEIRERLGGSINSLVKHFCRSEKDRGSLTILLCGEGGLVSSMELIFQYGFRSARLFRNRFFIWDFLEKVMACFESLLKNHDYVISAEIQTSMKSFCYVVSRIDRAPQAVGKDERFQMFICFGVRDRLLPRYMKLVSRSPVTISMYEEQSFLRDPKKLQFVLDLLEPLKEFNVTLESSIIRGVEL